MAYSEGNDEPVLVNDSIDYEQPDEEDEESIRNNENINPRSHQSNLPYARMPPGGYRNPSMQGPVYGQPMMYQPIKNQEQPQIPPSIDYGQYVKQRRRRQVESTKREYQGIHRQSATGTLAP